MKKIYNLIVAAILLAVHARADKFSYVYIQGDKTTPIYVKLDDKMMPRFGKHHCIIPQLAAGPQEITVLFQQNAFPQQKFNILIPEAGSRTFMLVNKNGSFSLYDLQQGFYLEADNKIDDDHLPANIPAVATATTYQKPPAQNKAIETEEEIVEIKEQQPAKQTPAVLATKPSGKNDNPEFIKDIEIKNPIDNGDGTVNTKALPFGNGTQMPESRNTVPAILNSDCPAPLGSEDFSAIHRSMRERSGDEDRLGYVFDKMDKCFATWQVRAMSNLLETDAARFSLLKKIYSRVADQQDFPLLDDLLRSDTWKAQFNDLTRK